MVKLIIGTACAIAAIFLSGTPELKNAAFDLGFTGIILISFGLDECLKKPKNK